jgi:hypothetical protein
MAKYDLEYSGTVAFSCLMVFCIEEEVRFMKRVRDSLAGAQVLLPIAIDELGRGVLPILLRNALAISRYPGAKVFDTCALRAVRPNEEEALAINATKRGNLQWRLERAEDVRAAGGTAGSGQLS